MVKQWFGNKSKLIRYISWFMDAEVLPLNERISRTSYEQIKHLKFHFIERHGEKNDIRYLYLCSGRKNPRRFLWLTLQCLFSGLRLIPANILIRFFPSFPERPCSVWSWGFECCLYEKYKWFTSEKIRCRPKIQGHLHYTEFVTKDFQNVSY